MVRGLHAADRRCSRLRAPGDVPSPAPETSLQWAETGLYVAVSALLAGLAFWWTKRKLS